MWDELGIAPSDDPKAIRRAYARRLKQLDLDRNPEAFSRLRAALEWALAKAGGASTSSGSRSPRARETDGPRGKPPPSPADESDEPRADPTDDLSAQASDRVVDEEASEPNPGHPMTAHQGARSGNELLDESAADRALLAALDCALGRGEAAEATTLYYRAAATGAIPVQAGSPLLERLLRLAVEDRKLDGAALRDLARSVGWDKPPLRNSAPSELRDRVTSRLAAEDWYEAQVAAADKRRRTTRRERKIARLILGRIGRRRMPRVDKIALRARLGEFRAHERWLRHRIDPAWVGVLDQRLRRRETRALVFFGLFLAALLANGARVYIVDASNGELSIALLLAGPLGAAFLLWILKLIVTELVRLVRPSLSVPSGAALGRLRGLFQRRSTRQPRDVDR